MKQITAKCYYKRANDIYICIEMVFVWYNIISALSMYWALITK